MTILTRIHNPFEWLKVDQLHQLNQLKLDKLSAGEDVIDLSMINPDIEPPRFIMDKLVESSLHAERHRYAVSRGVRRLREAFAHKYSTVFGVELDPEINICSAMGSKEGVLHTLTALNSRKSRALIGAPTYAAYNAALDLCGIDYDYFHISNDENLMLEEINSMTTLKHYSVLLLNFPNNPTGVIVSKQFYQKLHQIAEKNEFFIINDFVYGEMSFVNEHAESLLATDGALSHSIEIYSLSKAYSIPGWRVAAVLGNPSLISQLGRLKSKIDYGIFLPIQDAAAAALTSTENLTTSIVDKYRRRSQLVVSGLRKLGWRLFMPRAGASIWAKIPNELGNDGDALAYHLLDKFNIMVLPGSMFGNDYVDYIRFALVASEDKLQRMLDSLDVMGCDSQVRYANS